MGAEHFIFGKKDKAHHEGRSSTRRRELNSIDEIEEEVPKNVLNHRDNILHLRFGRYHGTLFINGLPCRGKKR